MVNWYHVADLHASLTKDLGSFSSLTSIFGSREVTVYLPWGCLVLFHLNSKKKKVFELLLESALKKEFRFPWYHTVTTKGHPQFPVATLLLEHSFLLESKRDTVLFQGLWSLFTESIWEQEQTFFPLFALTWGFLVDHRNEDMPLKAHSEKNVPQRTHFFQISSLYACSS